ncbi:MAG: L-histidine N(alpha)-methyltransferase [Patescibacteria group bacterium]
MIKKEFTDVEDILEKRLNEQVQSGKLEGEQWFRNPLGWLLVCFNNPLNFKNPNGELVVLQNNQNEISKYIKGLNQIHYGVGVGETELEIVRFELEQSKVVSLEGIDINKTFIELFGENLKDKEFEFGKNSIQAKLIQDLFQNYQPSFNGNTLHVCLGGTLGNFDDSSSELWSIFQKNSKSGDCLLVGVKMDKYVDIDFKKYQTNYYYPAFVLSHIKNVDASLIKWRKDENNYFRMSYDGIEVFRTRRFNKDNLIKEAGTHGFKFADSWTCEYEHSLVVLFKRN